MSNLSRMRVRFIHKLPIFIAVIAILAISLFAFKYFAPFGKVVSFNFSSKIPKSEQAVILSEGKGNSLAIPSQIVRTSISRFVLGYDSPTEIDGIKARIKFKKGPKEIKLGIKGSEKDNFYYRPFYHYLIQDLNWNFKQEQGFNLWQRDMKFNSLNELVNSPPEENKIVSYFIDPDQLVLLSPALTSNKMTVFNSILRGNISMSIKVTSSPFEITITKQDINSYQGGDEVSATVLLKGAKLFEKTIHDDGIVDASQLKSLPQEERIKIDNIKPGVYNLDLKSIGGKLDSVITKIEVNQERAVFNKNIFILGDKPSKFWTNSNKIYVSTWHESSLQTLMLNGSKELKLTESQTTQPFDLGAESGETKPNTLYQIESPLNDIIVETDGYFTFNPESFFNPDVIRTKDINTVSDLNDYDYVLTTVSKTQKYSN